jgi:hypothetical protein
MPNKNAGDSIVSFLVLEDPRFPAFVGFATFLDTGRLTLSLRAGRALRAAGLFAELFFFVGFAIALTPLVNRLRPKNGRLIKNISPTAQADSVKKFTALQTGFRT